MKHLLSLFPIIALLSTALSCKTQLDPDPTYSPCSDTDIGHDQIVLGSRLEDPYALENVKSAYVSLYPTKSRDDIRATHYYVRFLPSDDGQLEALRSLGLQLLDHPLDFEIVREGDWYKDPGLDEDSITWQYTVVPADFVFPEGIRYELLHECYMMDETQNTRAASDVDWEAVEAESFRLTGNESMLCTGVKAQTGDQPSGRITIRDPQASGGQPVGVSGVEVSCNLFVKSAKAYTDRDGYYQIPKKFSASPRYRLVFKNEKGFSIGFNSILYPASVSTLGSNPATGVNVEVTSSSDRKLFRRCVVNNAACEFYRRCDIGDLNLPEPPADLCFWIFDDLDLSNAVMLHHGTLLDKESSNKIFKIISWVVCFFTPDIALGTKGCADYASIYQRTVHEMAHACHFRKVGTGYWNEYIKYIVSCALAGQDTYGDGTLDGSGYCAVGEDWAYYMQNRMYMDRYDTGNPYFGSSFWFHPQMLSEVEARGLSAADIFAALTPDVKSKNGLREALGTLYPSKKTSIDQIFNRYD